MKGRTNVGGGGTLAINGETEKFTVADGARVAAGDFVEYRTQQNESLLSNSVVDTYDHVQIAENLAITLSNNALLLLKMVNGQLKIINSYNDYVVTDYTLLSDGGIAVRVNISPYIIKIKVENEQFQFICSAEGIPADYPSSRIRSLVEYNGKLYLFGSVSYIETRNIRYELKFYRFDITDSEQILYIDFSETEENNGFFGAWSEFEIVSSFVLNDYIYFVNGYMSTSSGNTLYRLQRFKINDETKEPSNLENISREINTQQKPITFYGKYVFWAYSNEIYLYNANAKTTINVGLASIGFAAHSSASTPEQNAFSKINNDKLALFCRIYNNNKHVYETAIIQIDEFTGNMNRISNIFNPSFENLSATFVEVMYLNGVVNDIMRYSNNTSKTYSILYNPETNILSDEVDTTSVKPYTGGSTLGVSKQSGTSGQKIEVYVPKIVTE